ncbi:MAG: hypothetical protein GY710_18550 [Desulfobacteraceae bacterium]|nr:hypothetical protein [Desulfobacteraceae bacterium]
MILNDLLNAVCADFKVVFPDLKECKPHGGRFDKKELKRISGKAPAIYVAPIATGKAVATGTGEQDLPVSMAAFVATIDQRKLPRAVSALNLVEGLIARINDQVWGIPDLVHPAGPGAAKNLYSGEIDRIGIALWVVSWQQTVRLGEDIWKTDFPMPTKLYIGFAPDIGEGHEDDYQLIGESK